MYISPIAGLTGKRRKKWPHLNATPLSLSLIYASELFHSFSDFNNVTHQRDFRAEDAIYLPFWILSEMLLGMHFLIKNSKTVLRNLGFS